MKLLKQLYNITVNHYNVAFEHIESHTFITHKPTMFQALLITLHDTMFYTTLYDEETTSYVIYEVVSVPTLGVKYAQVIRVYTPKEHRGKGITSMLLDKIPYLTVSAKGQYGEVAKLYLCRKVF